MTKADYVEGDILTIEELVYPGCKTNEALVKKLAIGSMVHVVDDGLPQRTVVYRIMGTLQSNFAFALSNNGADYFKNLVQGFTDDNEDIQGTAFGIVANTAEKKLNNIINHLDAMKKPLTVAAKGLLKKSKAQGAEGARAQDQTKRVTNLLWRTQSNSRGCRVSVPSVLQLLRGNHEDKTVESVY